MISKKKLLTGLRLVPIVGPINIRAGSIPDSYDIYRYLNLVRYSIFDTRYFRRKLA